MNSPWRRLIKKIHPEGIPWPGSILYNTLSSTSIFLKHYELVANDIAGYGRTGSILDIGTGPAQLLFALRKIIPDARLVGVDISSAMIEIARQNINADRRHSQIEMKRAGANALPFEDDTFDCVVSTGSLHHWKDPVQDLSEAHRVLKTGGYALIYDLVREMPKPVREDVRERFGSFRLVLLWLHSFEEPFLSTGEMEAIGRQTAFAVEGTKFTGALCCLVLKKTAVP